MRLYTWFIVQVLYNHAGESNVTLVLYVLAWSGAESYVETILTPPFKIEDSGFLSVFLWILQSLVVSASMRHFGAVITVDILVYYLCIRQIHECNVRLQELMTMCKEPTIAARLKRDHEFAEEITSQTSAPFMKFGAALGVGLQTYVPLKYTVSVLLVFVACRLILKVLNR